MKALKLSVIIAMLLAMLSSCVQPPADNISSTDAGRYMHFNDFVSDTLNEHFEGILPAAEMVDLTTAQYYYNYNCAVFGSPNFIIYLKNSFVEPDLFESELVRITTMATQTVSISDNETLYIVRDVSDDAKMYMDDEIQDGLTFRFEMAIVNASVNSIEYLSAWQCDENSKHELIVRFVGFLADNQL